MRLELSSIDLFENNELIFEKKKTFIYGKNGTGKSTLTEEIRKQCVEFDVRVFQGFEELLDENKRLNAVVLGKENKDVMRKIIEREKYINDIKKEKTKVCKDIEPPENKNEINCWIRYESARKDFEKKEKEMSKIRTQIASEIKAHKVPYLYEGNYDARVLVKELEKATLLDEKEKIKTIDLLKTEYKMAKDIYFPKQDLIVILKKVDNILKKKVEEKIKIVRLENSVEKRSFAEKGLHIHKKGDICAFCGNQIQDRMYDELESYFSADEVYKLRKEIDDTLKEIIIFKSEIERLDICENEFYPEFIETILELKNNLGNLKSDYFKIIEQVELNLKEKCAFLFEEMKPLNIDVPRSFNEISSKYQEYKKKNNENDLPTKQFEARNKLRLHILKQKLDEHEYYACKKTLTIYEEKLQILQKEYDSKRALIIGVGGFDDRIRNLQKEILDLQEETKNEELLAININKKLKNMVSFELEHYDSKGEKGYYLIKNIYTKEVRDITQLSTGEKNIIAFLYFIEKLKEISGSEERIQPKLVVFDDPMNSNDDNMQYLIMEELRTLMEQLQYGDKFILLTHNNHFYLNVKFGLRYNENSFIHLMSNREKTTFLFIDKKEDDFTTSYESLWKELIYLYNSADVGPELILNPMRRILETYIRFNNIGINKFYKDIREAKKLFDVNSHSIDDLEADLCGKTKEQIVELFCRCFYLNDAICHFQNNWKEFNIDFERLSED